MNPPKMPAVQQAITLSLPLICLAICFCAPKEAEILARQLPAMNPPIFEVLPISNNPKYAAANLIEIGEIDPSIVIDLQYTRPTTIAKYPLYPENFPALLRPETALRLKLANDKVKQHGLRLKIWDAYRPPSVQWELYEASGRNDTFVANPNNAPSQHSCGTAVDVTLVNIDGSPIPMPTGFDDFTPQASSYFNHADEDVAKNLKILQRAMRESGFHYLPAEWWHYIDANYRKYSETIPLDRIQ